MVKVVILSEHNYHFVSCSACSNSYFLLTLEIKHVLNGTIPEIQHRKWAPISIDLEDIVWAAETNFY